MIIAGEPSSGLDETLVSFGPFCVVPARRVLLRDDRPVTIGSRALEILIALIERPGELIDKYALMERAWLGLTVDESNLRAQIAALRRILGGGSASEGYIATISSRGYRFVAPVRLRAAAPRGRDGRNTLPMRLVAPIGRDEIVAAIAEQLGRRRFVTLVGAGGIGKTTVALAIAQATGPRYRDGIHLVDLAPVSDPTLVPGALASALGLPVRSEEPAAAVAGFLVDKQALLVLDSCEHAVEEVAFLAETVLRGAPAIHVLATSREPLMADGEVVHRLLPLAAPATSVGLKAAHALAYPAVELFVERAAAAVAGFALEDDEAPVVADICRSLDGIPLAIELAAGRVDAFGVTGVAKLLDDCFRLLSQGRRTALPRHRTLRATLDWSYEFLSPVEQVVLARMAVFAGEVTLETIVAVISAADLPHPDVPGLVASLIAKSLMSRRSDQDPIRYRLLDTTRAYALEQLVEKGEFPAVARRHAGFYQALLERAASEVETLSLADWLKAYADQVADVRRALDWAFSRDGDEVLGRAVTAAATPMWMLLSLVGEFRRRTERALADWPADADRRQRMQLLAGLGATLLYIRTEEGKTSSVWSEVLEIAAEFDDLDYRLRALWGLWVDSIISGDFPASLDFSRMFLEAARGTDELPIGDRMAGVSLLYLGELASARQSLERMLRHYVSPTTGSQIMRFQFDHRLMARVTLAQILWLQGFPDRAMAIVEQEITDALPRDHGLSLCNALGQGACAVALFTSNLDALERYVEMLLVLSARHTLPLWYTWGRCFEGVLLVRRGSVGAGAEILRGALDTLSKTKFALRHIEFLGEWAQALGELGEVETGIGAIDEALARSAANEETWFAPELMRIKGELLLRQREPDVAAAEAIFARSLEMARAQSALSWELRTAISAARLCRSRRRTAEGRQLLASVYDRFDEGFATADVLAAERLLDDLSSPEHATRC